MVEHSGDGAVAAQSFQALFFAIGVWKQATEDAEVPFFCDAGTYSEPCEEEDLENSCGKIRRVVSIRARSIDEFLRGWKLESSRSSAYISREPTNVVSRASRLVSSSNERTRG